MAGSHLSPLHFRRAGHAWATHLDFETGSEEVERCFLMELVEVLWEVLVRSVVVATVYYNSQSLRVEAAGPAVQLGRAVFEVEAAVVERRF